MGDLDYIRQEAAATTLSGVEMVRRYGRDTAGWPTGHWRNLLDRAATLAPAPPPVSGPTFTGGDLDGFVRSIPNHGVGYLAANGTLTRAIRPDDGCAPVFTITSKAGPFTVGGRIDVRAGCTVTFDTVRIHETGAPGSAGASWVVASPCRFVQCDLTNDGTKIGLITNQGAAGWQVDRCVFHDIGQTNPDDNGQHGVYDTAGGGLVTDSVFVRCADRGVQLRESNQTVVQNVLVEDCGEGIIFGDLTTRGCRVSRSVFRNNRVKSRFLVEALGDVQGCIVDDCYVYNDDGRAGVQPGIGGMVSVTGVRSGVPAAGYGPRFPVGC